MAEPANKILFVSQTNYDEYTYSFQCHALQYGGRARGRIYSSFLPLMAIRSQTHTHLTHTHTGTHSHLTAPYLMRGARRRERERERKSRNNKLSNKYQFSLRKHKFRIHNNILLFSPHNFIFAHTFFFSFFSFSSHSSLCSP